LETKGSGTEEDIPAHLYIYVLQLWTIIGKLQQSHSSRSSLYVVAHRSAISVRVHSSMEDTGNKMAQTGGRVIASEIRAGRPRATWQDYIRTCTELSLVETVTATDDRSQWKKIVRDVAERRTLEDG